jgi:hypothetical protein
MPGMARRTGFLAPCGSGARAAWLGCALAMATALSACSPALDWRQVRPQDTGVTMMFPCKPVSQARQLTLADQTVRLALHACSADGHTWGLAEADTGDPTRVTAALRALQQGVVANVEGKAEAPQALAVRGATPNEASLRQRVQGRRPDGSEVVVESVVFAHGTRVYQATVLGPAPRRLASDAVDTFFTALRVGS